MRERLRKAISKFPGYSVTFAAIVGFLLASTLQLFQVNSEIEKFYRVPTVNFSITWPDMHAITVDVPASKVMRLPSADNNFTIKWMAIPVKAEFINPTSSPVSFRKLELTFLVKERESLRPCEDPDYYKDEQYKKGIHGGFYTWIVRNQDINPNEDINVPITIGASQIKVIEIDFLTVPLIPETVASAKRTDMNSFNTFCIRWVDQAGTKYVSNTYHPLNYSRSASNKSLQGARQKAVSP
ncbi:MAG: hypothetical protein ACYC1T_10840 [Sulfuricaulis sp.]